MSEIEMSPNDCLDAGALLTQMAKDKKHIEALEEQLAKGREINHEWATHNEYLKERNRKLEEALPKLVARYEEVVTGPDDISRGLDDHDLTAARAALSSKGE